MALILRVIFNYLRKMVIRGAKILANFGETDQLKHDSTYLLLAI